MAEYLSEVEKQTLLRLAREALEAGVHGKKLPPVAPDGLTPLLRSPGASFVTLTIAGNLRGCIGALEPYQPLYQDVREHAVAAALEDYRFPPMRLEELSRVHLEVSRLTMPEPLIYTDTNDLLSKLRPGIDGVILHFGPRRATFLPQVWSQLPDKAEFLSHLCVKMGASSRVWQERHLEVQVYQVEEFHEEHRSVSNQF